MGSDATDLAEVLQRCLRMLAIADRLVVPDQDTERARGYECLPGARLRAEGAIALGGASSEIDIGLVGDAAAMAAALVGLGRHVGPPWQPGNRFIFKRGSRATL